MTLIEEHALHGRFGFGPLTLRQREVLAAVAAAGSAAAAAERLALDRRSVEGHLIRIHHRLGLETTLQCVALAVSRGWIPVPAWRAPAPRALPAPQALGGA